MLSRAFSVTETSFSSADTLAEKDSVTTEYELAGNKDRAQAYSGDHIRSPCSDSPDG